MTRCAKFPAMVLSVAWLLAGIPGHALAAEICLRSSQVDNAVPTEDGKAIDFRMKDGTIWRNTIRGNCSDLKFSGFKYVIRGGIDQICSNLLQLHVLRSSQICHLGNFTKIQDKKPAPR